MITCYFEDGGKAGLRHVVVHAIVEKDGTLLLVKRAGPILETGKWSLPSGFMDRDETAGEAIIREILEETGWQCEVISLFRINTNPNRPKEDRQNVSFVYLAKPIQHNSENDDEISEVQWFDLDKLPQVEEIAFDHYDNINIYLESIDR